MSTAEAGSVTAVAAALAVVDAVLLGTLCFQYSNDSVAHGVIVAAEEVLVELVRRLHKISFGFRDMRVLINCLSELTRCTGASKAVVVEPHRLEGVFIARSGAKDVLVTKNLTPGESVYGEKRISVEVSPGFHRLPNGI